MKKLLSVMLAAVMAFSLVACGGSNDSGTPANDGNTPVSTESKDDETPTGDGESDLAYVQNKGTLVVGITDFEPMDYQDADGNWIGFDADMAKAFAESLGVTAEFQLINWDNKVFEIDSKSIDCVWNGMTLRPEVTEPMSCSVPYSLNAQVLVVPADKAGDFTDLTSLEGLTVAVEAGSAGKDAAEALNAAITEVEAQSDALREVAAGYADAAVIDLLMAGAMIGEGTSYADLTYVLNLTEVMGEENEEYGVGFRKDSDLVDAFNNFWAEFVANGKAVEIGTIYGVQESLILD